MRAARCSAVLVTLLVSAARGARRVRTTVRATLTVCCVWKSFLRQTTTLQTKPKLKPSDDYVQPRTAAVNVALLAFAAGRPPLSVYISR